MNQKIKNKIKKIKLILTGVDGVLTDGGMYYTSQGDIMKKFYVRDGMGVTLLKKENIPTMIVTKEETKMVKQWAKRMKIKKLFDGVLDKGGILERICNETNTIPKEVAYIADDVNDISLLKKVGFAATPSDGIEEVKKICDYICKKKSGEGAFREIADLVLSNISNQD